MALYSPDLFDSIPPANVRGGRARAKQAERDRQGRFLPTDPQVKATWTLDERHGVPGGIKRAQTAKRNRGKFQ